jgi:hypothetical protein
MNECINAVGFIFNNVKTYIKKDKNCKYKNNFCQHCNISPCNNCTLNSQYKVCIFKLKKEYFISSSLDISTSKENAWDNFKKNIIFQKNGNFVISVTKCNNTLHSFYANMIKVKQCDCCDSVIIYFKYNIISLKSLNELTNPINLSDEIIPNQYPYNNVCANYESNITYNLKSGLYKSVKFFNSSNYNYESYI